MLPPPCAHGRDADGSAVVLGSRISLIAGDALVLAVTWWKTYRLKKAADAAHVKTSIVALLLRDGAYPSRHAPRRLRAHTLTYDWH